MSNIQDDEFWIDPIASSGTTRGGGFHIHHAYDSAMMKPDNLVQFVSKRRLNIATARIAELERLRDAHKAEIEELKKAVRELAKK